MFAAFNVWGVIKFLRAFNFCVFSKFAKILKFKCQHTFSVLQYSNLNHKIINLNEIKLIYNVTQEDNLINYTAHHKKDMTFLKSSCELWTRVGDMDGWSWTRTP